MKKLLMILFIILAVIFLGIAIYYFITPADKLAHFLPGYNAALSKTHFKHGLAAIIVGIGFGLLAWFSSSNKTT
jgi:hypothetical protein